jgi:hypothetical protein
MGSPTLKADISLFQKRLRVYSKTRANEGAKGLVKQSRLLVRDLVKSTPPFKNGGGKGTFTQSFSAQRGVGKGAVARDIRKAFTPALNPKALKGLKPEDVARAKAYAKNGQFDKLATLLHRYAGGTGIVSFPQVYPRATVALHNQMRNRAGRVKSRKPLLVKNAPSINKLIREKQKNVGKWKSGWADSVNKLGVKGVANWAKRNTGGGYALKKLAGINPHIIMANTIRGEGGRGTQIASAAVRNRTRSMRLEIEKRINKAKRKAKL